MIKNKSNPYLLISLYLTILISLSSCGHSPTNVKVVDMGLKGSSVGTAIVQRNDTLSEIAERYDLSMRSIIAANKIKPPYVIYPNQRLRLPPPKTYKVRKGDTIYEISRMFSTTQTRVVRLNNISKPYRIYEGQVLKMPMPEQRIASVSSNTQATRTLRRKAKIAAPKMIGNGLFKMPVDGKIISSYGPKSGGLHNDGINIAAPLGAPIVSGQSGVVAYTGDGIEGYGNLILIRHDKGYMSAYAHLDRIAVKRGDILKQGQKIGTVGQTGNVDRPQLHFEIRKGAKALNPKVYL
jgi:murein DD-endopeptidase MepM/ murein hydrolase activator NlpD